jgi:type I restriction enzyme S subunit
MIGEVCSNIQYGYTASASEEPCGPRLLRITDIQNGQVLWPSVPYCQIARESEQKYLLHPGDIVFARTGGTVGKSFIISSVPERSVFASYLIRLSAHAEVVPKYLYYFFQSTSYWEQIKLKKGGLQGNVNATTLSSLKLFICPLNEQYRIVANIEELFSELNKGIENLKTARAQLKVYRQALLKHAFEGKLTAQWRAENRDKLEAVAALLKRIQLERTQRYQQQLTDWEAAGRLGSKPKAPKTQGDCGGIAIIRNTVETNVAMLRIAT